ncbi:hypothetical protein T439DRAFT_20892 [Meredithblackwellia eburnea MCA 4105]
MQATRVLLKQSKQTRVTGLQRQIFSLYKRSLRMALTKPPEHIPAWYQFISHHFRHPSLGGGLRKQDVGAIEYMLRRGEKMLDSYGRQGVKSVIVPVVEGDEDRGRWPQGWVVNRGRQVKERREKEDEGRTENKAQR